MSTTSTFLQLTVPQTSDNFSTAAIAANWNAIDAAPGSFVCTSSTRPTWASGQAGRLIYETDTNLSWEWNGTSFARIYPKGLLGSTTATSGSTISTTSQTTILTGTYTTLAGGRSVRFHALVPSISISGTSPTGALSLYVDGTQVQSMPINSTTAVDRDFSRIVSGLSAGSHTFVLSGSVTSGSFTITLTASATAPIEISVEEV